MPCIKNDLRRRQGRCRGERPKIRYKDTRSVTMSAHFAARNERPGAMLSKATEVSRFECFLLQLRENRCCAE